MSLRIGMCGLATMFWPVALARNLQAIEEADLRGVATMGASDEEIDATARATRDGYAKEFGVRVYDELEEMIDAEELDVVAVCTRHTLHADHVERAAAKGAGVYICKTMATTVEDARRIVAAGERNGVRIAVGPGGRLQPQHLLARELIESGRIGRPITLRISHNHGTMAAFGPGDWYRLHEEGGPELSLGWYVVDVLRGVLPGRIASVYAQYENFKTPDSPFMDQGKVILRYADGAIASCDMYFSNEFPFPTYDLEVIGTAGALRMHTSAQPDGVPAALLYGADGVQQLDVAEGDLWTADTAAWVKAFVEDTPFPIDAEEGCAITEISLACWQSAREGRAVEL